MFDAAALTTLPDAELRAGPFPTDRRPRLVATGYGGTVRSSFSGSSAYLAEAGVQNGTLDGAFTLFSTARPDRGLQLRGAWWKVQRRLHGERSGGFKFTAEFSAHLWRRHLPALAGTDIVSNFQLFSDEFFQLRARHDIRAFFYLDGTLHDYLTGYQDYDVAAVDPATLARVMDVERRGYHQADGIAVMSEVTAGTLVAEYGVPAERITVVAPGANLPDELAERTLAARGDRPATAEVTVGFIGVYPERKGLATLAGAVAELRRDGVAVRLRVIGTCPDHIAAMDGVDALGFISKAAEPDRFVDALAGIDLGCLLSAVEMSGIAVLEFLRCGIPVLATDVGGIPDNLRGGGGISVPVSSGVSDIAAVLRRFIADDDERRELVAAAEQRRDRVRWQRTAAELGELIAATP